MRSFLSVSDLGRPEIEGVLARAESFRTSIKEGNFPPLLREKVVGLLFEKPSTRTRTSFEVATLRLGGRPLYLAANELQLSRGEPVKDTARVLGRYLDIIVARVNSHDTLDELSRYSGVSIVNALSNLEHPTQIVSDLLTLRQVKGTLRGLNITYIGDGNNVCNSLLLGASIVGMNIKVACPEGYEPNDAILERAKSLSRINGSEVEVVHDPIRGAAEADALYTDVWISMGQEAETERRMKSFQGYQINSALLRVAKKDVTVMHCLPAHRGLEITDEVLEGEHSVVWQQAENKLYGAAAVLEWIAGRSNGSER